MPCRPRLLAALALVAAALAAGCGSPGGGSTGVFFPPGPGSDVALDAGGDAAGDAVGPGDAADTSPSDDADDAGDAGDGGAEDAKPDVPQVVGCFTDADCASTFDPGPCGRAVCNPVSLLCAAEPLADGTACDDQSLCTAGDACAAGACVGVPVVDCNDGNPCTNDGCDPGTGGCTFTVAPGAGCDDGSPCTVDDACQPNGQCAGAAKACDDGDPCTVDTCSPADGACAHAPAAAGSPCDDGNGCTTGDVCGAGGCAGVPKSCSDSNACTDDACDPATGACTHAVDTANPCSDGDACTADDVCLGDGTCKGTAKVCDDKNACTNDGCDPVTGLCVHTPDPTNACSDGDPCTTGDACLAGGTCKGTPKSCDDGNPCTADACNGATGACTHAPTPGVACDDKTPCTTGDVCKADGSCAGAAKTCNDGNDCTADACNPATGACQSTPQVGKACSDANACTTGDACNAAGTCTGTAKVCTDGNPCTTDACNASTGACSFSVNPFATCSDGDPCTTGDSCLTGTCAGTPKSCDDGKPCTDDACTPGTGACKSTPDTTNACSDGNACTTDVCNAAGTCVSTPVTCDDDDVCTVDSCSTTLGCQHVPVDCNDGEICTQDACDPVTGCANEPLVPCGAPLPFSEPFDCGAEGWTPEILVGTVTWAIDALPAVPGFYSPSCSLNMNAPGGGYDSGDLDTVNQVTSPVVDATGAATLWLSFKRYWDFGDTGSGYDKMLLSLSDDGFDTASTVTLAKVTGDAKTWRFVKLNISDFAGGPLQVRFAFDSVDDVSNSGAGWFLDDLALTEDEPAPPPEVCDDGVDNSLDDVADCEDPQCVGDPACPEAAFCDDALDNDGDGATDCEDDDCGADPHCLEAGQCDDEADNDVDGATDCEDDDCAADPHCLESGQCADGIDNDLDEKVDCADPDCLPEPFCCAADEECDDGDDVCTVDTCVDNGCVLEPTFAEGCCEETPLAWDFEAPVGFTTSQTSAACKWQVADAGEAVSGTGSLYYGDLAMGDYACGDNSGTATSPPITLPTDAAYTLGFQLYMDTESSPNYDVLTISAQLAGGAGLTLWGKGKLLGVGAWYAYEVDLSALAGKTFQLRFAFDTGDGSLNDGAGVFVDDVAITSTCAPRTCTTATGCDDGLSGTTQTCTGGTCAYTVP